MWQGFRRGIREEFEMWPKGFEPGHLEEGSPLFRYLNQPCVNQEVSEHTSNIYTHVSNLSIPNSVSHFVESPPQSSLVLILIPLSQLLVLVSLSLSFSSLVENHPLLTTRQPPIILCLFISNPVSAHPRIKCIISISHFPQSNYPM